MITKYSTTKKQTVHSRFAVPVNFFQIPLRIHQYGSSRTLIPRKEEVRGQGTGKSSEASHLQGYAN